MNQNHNKGLKSRRQYSLAKIHEEKSKTANLNTMYGLGTSASLFEFEDVSIDTLKRAIDAYANEDARRKVRFKTIIGPPELPSLILDLQNVLEDTELSIDEHQDHFEVNLTRDIVRSNIEGGRRSVSGSFALFESDEPNIWTAVTGESPDFYKRGIIWLFKQGRPEISNFYVTSRDLENFLDDLHNSLSSDALIRVNKAIAYTHRDEGTISFETLPYKEVFRVSRENNKYVDQIKFSIRRAEESVLTGFISRDGQSRFVSGNAHFFFRNILSRFSGLGKEKEAVFQDKQRSPETGEVNELEIQFEKEVLQTTKDNLDLIKALSNMTNSSVTVYHKNPYAHVSILDYQDGSSCDVFVTSSNEISIVPSYRGSLNSLMRVSEQISREFEEGVIREATHEEVEFSELFI